jgi:CBS domain containing-hemolysin-like protein
LEFSHKTAKDVMTDIEYVCMLEIDRKLDMETLAEILGMGHSRVPVFHSMMCCTFLEKMRL